MERDPPLLENEYLKAESIAKWGYRATVSFFDGPIYIERAGEPFHVKSGINWSNVPKLIDYATGSTEEDRKAFVDKRKRSSVPTVTNQTRFDELEKKTITFLKEKIVQLNQDILDQHGIGYSEKDREKKFNVKIIRDALKALDPPLKLIPRSGSKKDLIARIIQEEQKESLNTSFEEEEREEEIEDSQERSRLDGNNTTFSIPPLSLSIPRESVDLSETFFLYGMQCGFHWKELMDMQQKYDVKKPIPFRLSVVGHPNNRLRLRFNDIDPSPYMFEEDMRVYRHGNAGTLHFIAVYVEDLSNIRETLENIPSDAYVALMPLHTAMMLLYTIRMGGKEEVIPLVIGLENGEDEDVKRKSRNIVFVPIFLSQTLSLVDVTHQETLESIATIAKDRSMIGPMMNTFLEDDELYQGRCRMLFSILSQSIPRLAPFVGHLGLGHHGVFGSFGFTGTALLVHRDVLNDSVTPPIFLRYIDFGIPESPLSHMIDALRRFIGYGRKRELIQWSHDRLNFVFMYMMDDPYRAWLSSIPIYSFGLGDYLRSTSIPRVTTDPGLALSSTRGGNDHYSPDHTRFSFRESEGKSSWRSVVRSIRKYMYTEVSNREPFIWSPEAVMDDFGKTRIPLSSSDSDIVNNYPLVYFRKSLGKEAAKKRKLFLGIHEENIDRFRRIVSEKPLKEYRKGGKSVYNAMTQAVELETSSGSLLRSSIRQLLYRSYWDLGEPNGKYLRFQRDGPSILELRRIYGLEDAAFTIPRPERGEEEKAISVTFPVPFSYVVLSWLQPFKNQPTPGPTIFYEKDVEDKLTPEQVMRRMLVVCEEVAMSNDTEEAMYLPELNVPILGVETIQSPRYFGMMSVLSTTAQVMKIWIRFARRLDAIVPLRKSGEGSDMTWKKLLKQTHGFGIWTVVEHIVHLASENYLRDSELANENLPEPIDIQNDAHITRVTEDQGSNNWIPATILAEEIFDEYLRAFHRLSQQRWELGKTIDAFVRGTQWTSAETYSYTALRMWHLEARAQLNRLIDMMMMYFSFRRDALLGSTFSMFALHTGETDVRINEEGSRMVVGTEYDVKGYYDDLNTYIFGDILDEEEEEEEELGVTDIMVDTMSRWASTPKLRRALIDKMDPSTPLPIPIGKEGWDRVPFTDVRFRPDFTLLGFNPNIHYNVSLHVHIGEREGGDELKELLNLRKDHASKLRVRPSGDRFKGNGLFCDDARGIPPGAFILRIDGWMVRRREYEKAVRKNSQVAKTYGMKDAFVYGHDKKSGEPVFIIASSSDHPIVDSPPEGVPPSRILPWRYVNTACSWEYANCEVAHWIVNGEDQLWIINASTRTIQHGEELLLVYTIQDPLDYFRDIGLYARTPGFIYPPDEIRNLDSTMFTIDNYNVRNTRSHPSMHKKKDLYDTDIVGSIKKEIRVRETMVNPDERAHSMRVYLGTMLEHYRDHDPEWTPLLGSYQETEGKWYMPPRYIQSKIEGSFVIPYDSKYNEGEGKVTFDMYGSPVMRDPTVIYRKYVSPLFKRLRKQYGDTTIIDLEPTFSHRSYDNVPSIPTNPKARPVDQWDTALSVLTKSSESMVRFEEKVLKGQEITYTLFMARREEIYRKIEETDEEETYDLLVREAMDMSLQEIDGERGLVVYKTLKRLPTFSKKAIDALQKYVENDGGYGLYDSCETVASHYEMVQTDVEDIRLIDETESSLYHSEFIQRFMGKKQSKTRVLYTGDVERGLGLYADEEFPPGAPVIPFLGKIVTDEEYEHEKKRYTRQFSRALHEYQTLTKEMEKEEDRKTIANSIAKKYRIDHPDVTFYSAQYMELDGPRLMLYNQRMGNKARFANNSRYYANVTLQQVLVPVRREDVLWSRGIRHIIIPTLVNTSGKPIRRGEEILWDYKGHSVFHMEYGYESPPWIMDMDAFPPRPLKEVTSEIYVIPQHIASLDHEPNVKMVGEEESLFLEGATLKYGEGALIVPWSQSGRIVLPNTLGGSQFQSAHRGFEPTSIELLRTLLQVKGPLVLPKMTPCSKYGDLLNDPPYSHDAVAIQGLVSSAEIGAEELSDAIADAWVNASSLFHSLRLLCFQHQEETVDISQSKRDEWIYNHRGDNRIMAMAYSMNHAIDDLQERLLATVEFWTINMFQLDNVKKAMPERSLMYTFITAWRRNTVLMVKDQNVIYTLCKMMGFTVLNYQWEGQPYTMKINPEMVSNVYEHGDSPRIYEHLLDEFLLGNNTERYRNIYEGVIGEVGVRPETNWEDDRPGVAEEVVNRWKERNTLSLSSIVPNTTIVSTFLSNVRATLKMISEKMKSVEEIVDVIAIGLPGESKEVFQARIDRGGVTKSVSQGRARLDTVEKDGIVYSVSYTIDSFMVPAHRAKIRFKMFSSELVQVERIKIDKRLRGRDRFERTQSVEWIRSKGNRPIKSGGVDLFKREGESVKALPKNLKRVLKGAKKALGEVNTMEKKEFGGIDMNRPAQEFSIFRVHVEAYLDFIVLQNIFHIQDLLDGLINDVNEKIGKGVMERTVIIDGVETSVDLNVLSTYYRHAYAAIYILLDPEEVADYAGLQEWKRHRLPYKRREEGEGEEMIQNEWIGYGDDHGLYEWYGRGSSAYTWLVRLACSLYMGQSIDELVNHPFVNMISDIPIYEGTLRGRTVRGIVGEPWWSDLQATTKFWKILHDERRDGWKALSKHIVA